MGNVTLKTIADEAGVSVSTVSFCLNDSGRVGADTKQEVLKIAEKLNYTPNLAARELAGKKSTTIGVIIPDCADLKNAPLLKGIDNTLEKNNYFNLVCFTHNKIDRERAYINLLKGKNVDGLIIFPYVDSETSRNAEILNDLIDRGVPVVFVDTYLDNVSASWVITDNYQAAYEGTKFLLDHGHKKIAYIGGTYHMVGRERLRGYMEAIQEAGLYNRNFIYSDCKFNDKTIEIAEEVRKILIDNNPEAIMAFNYNSTLAVINSIKEYDQISSGVSEIIGFDYLMPVQENDLNIYTYNQPHFKMGEKAVEILLNEIKSDSCKQKNKIRLTAELETVSQKNNL
ncbi:MAG: LacI family DNA-binding transcriptional regulator [bacterium]